jgi:hypothetical protein
MKRESHRDAAPESGGEAWLARVRVLLDESEYDIEGATLSRLNRARQQALDTLPRRAPAGRWIAWIGGGAVTAALAWMLLRGPDPATIAPVDVVTSRTAAAPAALESRPAPSAPAIAPADAPVAAPDFELLADSEQMALLQDLEFYAWLQQQDSTDG